MERLGTIAKRATAATAPPKPDQSRAARAQFSDEMKHFAAAYRHELTDEAIPVYWLALKDIAVEIRTAGLTLCLTRLKFFPTVAEVLNACADVVDERRKRAAAVAKSLAGHCDVCDADHCPDCHGSGLRDVEGKNTVVRCLCKKREIQLVAEAGQPLSRPALPSSESPEVV